jgi:hypothetical protein
VECYSGDGLELVVLKGLGRLQWQPSGPTLLTDYGRDLACNEPPLDRKLHCGYALLNICITDVSPRLGTNLLGLGRSHSDVRVKLKF